MTQMGDNMGEEQNGSRETREKKKLSVRIHSFPCVSCGNLLTYLPGTSRLTCKYCKIEEEIPFSVFEVPEYIYDPMRDEWDAPEWETAESYTLSCPACGAEILSPMQAVTVNCPFCETAYVSDVPRGADIIPPEALLPFSVSEENAKDAFVKWAGKRFWAPFGFKKRVKATAMRGVYLPAWTFDTDLETSYNGFGGRRRIVTRTVRRNGKTYTETRTVTDWYPVGGVMQHYTDDHLIPASKKVDAKMFGEIAPYSTKMMSPYDPAYLAGLSAERYDVGPSDAFRTVARNAENAMERRILSSLGYDTYRGMSYRHRYSRVTFKEILLPVWRSSYDYHGKSFSYLVNGETGKTSGRYPVSAIKVTLAVLLSLGIACLIILLAMLGG